jgi:hypothetical protein
VYRTAWRGIVRQQRAKRPAAMWILPIPGGTSSSERMLLRFARLRSLESFTRALSLFKSIFEPICTDGDMESCTNKENAMGHWIFPILPRSSGTLCTYQLTFSSVRLPGKPGARSSERLWIMN